LPNRDLGERRPRELQLHLCESSVGKNSSGVVGQSAIFALSFETWGAAEAGVSHNLLRTCPEPNSLFFQRIIFLQDFALRDLGELGKIAEACFS